VRYFQTLISLNGLGWTRLARTSGGLQHQRGAGADHGHHCRLLLLHLQRFFLLALLAESLAVALQVPQRFGLCVTPEISEMPNFQTRGWLRVRSGSHPCTGLEIQIESQLWREVSVSNPRALCRSRTHGMRADVAGEPARPPHPPYTRGTRGDHGGDRGGSHGGEGAIARSNPNRCSLAGAGGLQRHIVTLTLAGRSPWSWGGWVGLVACIHAPGPCPCCA
jgi:hypothetical protein